MNRTLELRKYFESELLPHLKKLDTSRKALIAQVVIVIALGIIAVPIMAMGLFSISSEPWILLMFIPMFFLLGLMVYIVYESLFKSTNFYKGYKREIIKRLIKYVNPTLHYDNRLFVSASDFFRSNFYSKVPVKYDGDDHVSGQIDDVPVEFSELEVAYKSKTDNKDGKEYLFRGMFFVATCPKPFHADLVIETRKAGIVRANELDTSNPLFQDAFIAWAPKQEEREAALEMLTEDLMSSMIGFHNMIPLPIKVSFGYDKMYVAIEHEKSLLEPSLWKSALNFQTILEHYYDIYYPIAVIAHLAANKDINFHEESRVA